MADRGNMFCQAFEIQMPHSTLCLSDSFERSHKRTATEMEVPRAEVAALPKRSKRINQKLPG